MDQVKARTQAQVVLIGMDPYLNRRIQPDSIIPSLNNPLDWDRYSYVRNNPL